MKEICKNCAHSHPTYKGINCDVKNDKKVKTTGTCEQWTPKRGGA